MSNTDAPQKPREQGSARHWTVATGALIVMIGASILLSGLSIFTAPIISDTYYLKDEAGNVVMRTMPNGTHVPTEINGGQGAFLLYFTIMTFAIVIPLMSFAGPLLAKYGARTMLVVGGIIMSIGLVVFALSTGNLMFYVGGAIIGVGYGMSMALIPPALVNAWFVEKRGLVLGVVLAGTGVGGLIWAGIGPALAESPMGWRGVLWIMAGAMAVCTIVPALFLIRNKPADVGLAPYGASAEASAAAAAGRTGPVTMPGYTYKQALRSSNFWIICASFFIFGAVVAVTQVLSIVFRTAAYANPVDRTSWTPSQIAFYSSLFMVWLVFLVVWKPLLGLLNDKIGLVGMMTISMSLMAIALVYMPSMVFGSSVALMYVAMAAMASGISNATVTPPLVVGQAMGGKDFPKIFALAVAFYYAGNALGAPLWGLLGTSGNYALGMYASPVLLALFVAGSVFAAKRGRAFYDRELDPQATESTTGS